MKKIRITLNALFAYFTVRLLLYPLWWHYTLSTHRFDDLTYQIFGPMFITNLFFVAMLIAALYTQHKIQKSTAAWAIKIDSIISNYWILIVTTGLLLMAVCRSYFLANHDKNRPTSSAFTASKPISHPIAKASPIELFYFDPSRMSDVYSQIQDPFRITETKASYRAKAEIEAGGSALVANGRAMASGETEQSSTSAAAELSMVKKVVEVIENLREKNQLVQIRNFEVYSQELRKFDEAVHLLSANYQIPIAENAILDRRQALKNPSSSDLAPTAIPNGSWVVLEGETELSRQGPSIAIKFAQDPSRPNHAKFRCMILTSLIAPNSALSDQNKKTLEAKIFGKILQNGNEATGPEYTLTCYAIYL